MLAVAPADAGEVAGTKSRISPARRSGWSSMLKVSESSIHSSRESGSSAASLSACSGGKKRSSTDQAISTGRSKLRSFCAASSVKRGSTALSTLRTSRRTPASVSAGST